jgi:hypothetical protein
VTAAVQCCCQHSGQGLTLLLCSLAAAAPLKVLDLQQALLQQLLQLQPQLHLLVQKDCG